VLDAKESGASLLSRAKSVNRVCVLNSANFNALTARARAEQMRLEELQQGFDNRAPLVVEVAARDRFAGSSVPVSGIRLIAFTAMQVRVHPRAVRTGDVLRDLMRAVPVASPFVPQRLECARHARRRRGLLERCFELGKIHVDRIARPWLITFGGPGAIREACEAKRT
jgi:hypothetical protein